MRPQSVQGELATPDRSGSKARLVRFLTHRPAAFASKYPIDYSPKICKPPLAFLFLPKREE
jgi:hypothetical protein